RLERGRKHLADGLRRRGFAPDGADRALLLAAIGAVAVPGELLARTTALAAAPWSKVVPTAVVALVTAVTPSKLLPATALVLLAGAGAIGVLASPERERPEAPPIPVAQAKEPDHAP